MTYCINLHIISYDKYQNNNVVPQKIEQTVVFFSLSFIEKAQPFKPSCIMFGSFKYIVLGSESIELTNKHVNNHTQLFSQVK